MKNNVMIIGIAGPSASGKTLLANTIVEELGSTEVAVISEDSYYHDRSRVPVDEREKINYDHPESIDHALFASHLEQLQKGQSVKVPIYDFSNHARDPANFREVGPHRILVLEGILLFTDPFLREKMNIRIFMDTALDICLCRRIRRDMISRQRPLESVLEQYVETVRPMYHQFIEPTKHFADIIIPRGGENRIAIEMMKAKMRELLKQ